jgi:hypothetical protein
MAKKNETPPAAAVSAAPVNDQVRAFERMLIAEAEAFVKDNAADAAKLGEDVVRAVLFEQAALDLPAIPELPATATMEQRAEVEAMLAARSRSLQLVAKAFKEDAARVAALRAKAIGVAGKIASASITAVAGIAVRSLLGL